MVIDNFQKLIKSLQQKTGEKTSAIEHQIRQKITVKESPVSDKDARLQIKNTITSQAQAYDKISSIVPKKGSLGHLLSEKTCEFNKVQGALLQRKQNFIANSIYKDPQLALTNWYKLVDKYGIHLAIKQVTDKPKVIGQLSKTAFFFIRDEQRKEFANKSKASIKDLVAMEMQRNVLSLKAKGIDELCNKITDKLQRFSELKTHGLSLNYLKEKVKNITHKALFEIDRVRSVNTVNSITDRFIEQVIEFKDQIQTRTYAKP